MSKQRKEGGRVPEDKLREMASPPNGSLFYETLMLKESAARCVEPTGKRSLETNVPYYMAIECFLIHFRALRDFLCPDELVRKKNDNVIAFDYNSEWLQTEEDWKECSIDERIRVNRLLAHISYSRDTLERKWPIEAMRQSMMQRLAQFILSLPAKRQEWFESWGLNKTMAASIRRV